MICFAHRGVGRISDSVLRRSSHYYQVAVGITELVPEVAIVQRGMFQ